MLLLNALIGSSWHIEIEYRPSKTKTQGNEYNKTKSSKAAHTTVHNSILTAPSSTLMEGLNGFRISFSSME
jgi:hypothetical protein